MAEGEDLPMASRSLEAESPFASDDSSSSSDVSESTESIALSLRLSELSEVEVLIARLLGEASEAIDALNPAVHMAEDSQTRSNAFAQHSESFLELLEQASVRLKRSIRALEEVEVPIMPVQKRLKHVRDLRAIKSFLALRTAATLEEKV